MSTRPHFRTKRQHIRYLRELAFEAQQGKCYYCLVDMTEPGDEPTACTADHVKPRSLGGKTHEDNIVAACKRCNSYKEDRVWGPGEMAKRESWA